jgi:hypothetical protein
LIHHVGCLDVAGDPFELVRLGQRAAGFVRDPDDPALGLRAEPLDRAA